MQIIEGNYSKFKRLWAAQELFPEHLLLGGRLSREKGMLQATMKGWFGRKSAAAPLEQSAEGTSALEVRHANLYGTAHLRIR